MKTVKEINAEAKKFAPDDEAMQEAFIQGVRYALTGRYYKEAELFNETKSLAVKVQDAVFIGENDSFEDWWEMYQKKRGKKKAKQKWDRLTEEQQTACLLATPAYVASTPDPVYRKDPLTYLNGECWNDEIINKPNYEQQRTISLASKAARILSSPDNPR